MLQTGSSIIGLNVGLSPGIFHIGLDDTDSSDGMCTTFLAYNLAKILQKKNNTRFIDFPNLIRLNPNIPWKTRGNASLVLRIETTIERQDLFRICMDQVDRFATHPKANAGLAIHEGEKIPDEVTNFSRRALFDVERLSNARKIMNKAGIMYYGKRNKQGLIGALAGIGNELRRDYTFELIAYRRNCSSKRVLDTSKIIEMDRKTKPSTFNCYDAQNDRVLIMPHGPDPVYFGIRGETPRALIRAFEMLMPLSNFLGYMIFRSNQGTGEHLLNDLNLSEISAYTSGKVNGAVSTRPEIREGGHVFFLLKNDEGSLPCAAYEPTGHFRMNILALREGDIIEVGGGIRKGSVLHRKILNLEYMIPRRLVTIWRMENPKCPNCLVSLSPDHVSRGFRCKKCNYTSANPARSASREDREIIENRLYTPDLKAQRHLTKPQQRYNFGSKRRIVTPQLIISS